ncbi:MAG: hypothetical protein HQL39_03850 [Alphaproteobacteria bacterium]|nr:hypothetical protein [Alphaproteobacteria bacterium]
MRRTAWIVGVAMASALAGCAYGPDTLDDPIGRKFAWFSFLDAGDLRADCAPGRPDRWRLVYNGAYEEQVRIYQLDGPTRRLSQRVIEPADLTRGWTAADPLGPWRGVAEVAALDPAQYAGLLRALDQSGLYEAPPEGLRLGSERFWWLAAACRDGRFFFNAWLHPTPRFERLPLWPALARLDVTGVPFNPPRPPGPRFRDPDRELADFTVEVGRAGLKGVGPP